MNNILEVNNLSKNYYTLSGEIKALSNINFSINEGDFVAIIGSSGCGKSTLLNILANIDNNYKGNIIFNKQHKKIGYMLQNDALLPWLTIKENCMLGLKLKHQKDNNKVLSLLQKYNLIEFINKYPHELSGGMRQRVALIRTLLTNPDILLLDEPFSALDYQTRLNIENDVYKIIKKEKVTTIIVTHDLQEAISMANKVIVLSKRPAKIKNIYDIKLEKALDPINNRNDIKFNYYFNLIWKDLNSND